MVRFLQNKTLLNKMYENCVSVERIDGSLSGVNTLCTMLVQNRLSHSMSVHRFCIKATSIHLCRFL